LSIWLAVRRHCCSANSRCSLRATAWASSASRYWRPCTRQPGESCRQWRARWAIASGAVVALVMKAGSRP